jgi:ribose transport system permease protein
MTSGTEPTDMVSAEAPATREPDETVPFFQRFMERVGPFWTLGVLIILILVFGFIKSSLYSKAAWQSTSSYAVEYLILAVGETFVIMTSGIDLSVGATLGFSGMLGADLMQHMIGAHDGSTEVAILGVAAILASGAAIGLLNGLLITRLKLPPFIVTLGTLTAITGATDLLTNATEITTLPNFVTNLGTDSILNGWLPWPVLISLIIAIVFGLILARTRFGLRTQAIGSNEIATRRAGVRVDRHLIWVYVIAGLLAGVAGLMVTANFSAASPVAGQNDELYAIAAVVIGGASIFGGRGTIFGTVIGTAILSILTTGLVLINLQTFWQQVAIGAVVIIAVAVDRVRTKAGTD